MAPAVTYGGTAQDSNSVAPHRHGSVEGELSALRATVNELGELVTTLRQRLESVSIPSQSKAQSRPQNDAEPLRCKLAQEIYERYAVLTTISRDVAELLESLDL